MREVRTRLDWAKAVLATAARRALSSGRSTGYIGWTIAGNLGDTAMYEAAQKLFISDRLEIFSGARREAALASFGLSGSARFQRVFLGGGTLINHGYLGVIRKALQFGLPISTLGTGVGSSGFSDQGESIGYEWRDALNAMERVGVRGPRSLAKLRSIGVDKAEVIGDLALALTATTPIDPSLARGFILNAARPSARDGEVQAMSTTLEALANATKALVGRGLMPIPVAFCREDVAPTLEVLKMAGLEGCKLATPATANAFFDLANGARLTLGVRLHAAVLSCCLGIPPLAIAYREKGHDFAESMGCPSMMVDPKMLEAANFTDRAIALADQPVEVGRLLHRQALAFKENLTSYAVHA
jgi:hypothetical protein